MRAYDIEWEVSDLEILEKLNEMDVYSAADALNISAVFYSNMDEQERHEAALNYFYHRHKSCRADFVGLPSEVELDDIFNSLSKEDVIDWLEQQYGNYVEDCNLER